MRSRFVCADAFLLGPAFDPWGRGLDPAANVDGPVVVQEEGGEAPAHVNVPVLCNTLVINVIRSMACLSIEREPLKFRFTHAA